MSDKAKNAPVPFMVDGKGLQDLLSCTIPAKLPVLITGMPGGGKTSHVKQAVQKVADSGTNVKLFISHPVVKTPTDYSGFPWMKDGKAEFIPYSDLECILASTVGDEDSIICFFIDDLGQATKTVQAAMMQIVLEREINGHKVADQVVFVAATNRKQDKAAVSGIIEPLKSRFHTIVEYQPDAESWVEWAMQNHIDPGLIAFIRFRPHFLTDFRPSNDMSQSAVARTIHNLNDLVALNLPVSCRYAAYAGAVGADCANEWKAFEDMKTHLPSIRDILDGRASNPPQKVNIIYALLGALIGKVNHSNLDNVYKYLAAVPFEFQALWHKDVKAMRPELVETSAYTNWSAKYGKNLS